MENCRDFLTSLRGRCWYGLGGGLERAYVIGRGGVKVGKDYEPGGGEGPWVLGAGYEIGIFARSAIKARANLNAGNYGTGAQGRYLGCLLTSNGGYAHRIWLLGIHEYANNHTGLKDPPLTTNTQTTKGSKILPSSWLYQHSPSLLFFCYQQHPTGLNPPPCPGWILGYSPATRRRRPRPPARTWSCTGRAGARPRVRPGPAGSRRRPPALPEGKAGGPD